jgi:hypothetical protein
MGPVAEDCDAEVPVHGRADRLEIPRRLRDGCGAWEVPVGDSVCGHKSAARIQPSGYNDRESVDEDNPDCEQATNHQNGPGHQDHRVADRLRHAGRIAEASQIPPAF